MDARVRCTVMSPRVYGQDAGQTDNEGGVQSGSRTAKRLPLRRARWLQPAPLSAVSPWWRVPELLIGLLIGGAGGAGSLAVQGSKELKLENGTELLATVTR